MKKSKKILFITVNRSDYGIWRQILRIFQATENLSADIFVTGAHFSQRFGNSIDEIYADAFCDHVFEAHCDYTTTGPNAASLAMSEISKALGEHLSQISYDAVAVLGDRFEMLTAASTVVPFRIPIIHFHGGSITEGAIDDSFRHAITKLSHYHMVETENFKNRIRQLGEPEDKIIVTGAPSLSALRTLCIQEKDVFLSRYGLPIDRPFVLVTLHSETTKDPDYNRVLAEVTFNVLAAQDFHLLITAPNPDPHHEPIFEKIDQILMSGADATFVKHLGHENYLNALHHCFFVAGNSSSGIIEAASLDKCALNIGDRQKKRLCDPSVVHANLNPEDIQNKINLICQWLEDEGFDFKPSICGEGCAPEIFIEFLESGGIGF